MLYKKIYTGKKRYQMDMVTSLLGNKIFSSLYDPKSDTLLADFRKKAEESLGSFHDVLSKGVNTKAILNKIPGVSTATKNELDKLLAESKSFTTNASNLSPSTILAKKAEISTKISGLVKTAQAEGVAEKKNAAEKAKKEKGRKFSFVNSYTRFKKFFFYAILVCLVLWGGSISSNAAFKLPVQMRFYYFIYGSILFPISFIFAIKRYFSEPATEYHALLAPLIEGPIKNTLLSYLLFPFTYVNLFVDPLPVHFVEFAQANSERSIQAKITTNSETQVLAAAAPKVVPAGLPMVPPPELPIQLGGDALSIMETISANATA